MKTEFAEFCRRLGEEVSSFHQQLGVVLSKVRQQQDAEALSVVVKSLGDVHHRLEVLEEKASGQQAYVSIFGPLKSGKSTLMNAISGAYVSEITSLPAYPCMVYVRDAESQQITITGYNGRKQECAGSQAMQETLRQAHAALAEKIRESEERGEDFEPASHYPDAIRRVDIGLPAPSLRESQTVLVDTPGLYSRMKFGYEMMTREFRDSAASAIFVVKTDNLFLEQVFEEFNELLDLFSRIFLIVNLDSSKQDIGPDGQLRPSLESRDPAQIIQAFEALSMSAPLRKAADEGRLKIYPVDLLHAALFRMQKVEEGKIPAVGQQAMEAFQDFFGDLTDYLNSSDYLKEFMSDSWRQGRNLSEEVKRWCLPEQRQPFELLQQNLRLRLAQSESSLRDLKSFTEGGAAYGFEFASASFSETVLSRGKSCAEMLKEESIARLHAWWATDESLLELAEERIRPCVRETLEVFAENIHRSLQEYFPAQTGGLNLTNSQAGFLREISLSIEEVRESALQQACEYGEQLANQHLEFNTAEIPVRKGWLDWLLFRGPDSIRKGLFGPADAPSKALSQKKKRGRMGDVAKLQIQQQLELYLEHLHGVVLREHVKGLLEAYISAFQQSLKERLADVGQRLQQTVEDSQQRIHTNEQIVEELIEVSRLAGQLQENLSGLADEYGVSRFGSVLI